MMKHQQKITFFFILLELSSVCVCVFINEYLGPYNGVDHEV